LVLLAALFACGACGDNDAGKEPGTWYGEVGVIVRAKCGGCHAPDGVAPFSLLEYDDVLEQTGKMAVAIEKGIMPPWYALDPPDCTPTHAWRDDGALSEGEKSTILNWIAYGTPEGTVRDLPPPTRPSGLADPTLELAPANEFISSGNKDQFVCFLFDPQLDHAQWLTGSHVTPTAVDLVHHVNVYLIGPAGAEDAKTFTGGLGVPKLPCDHPPGAAIQSWLPGNPALVLPDKVGIPVDPGTLVLLQVHYHPAGIGGPDATSVALRFTDTRPDWRFDLGVYGNSPGPPNLQPGPGDDDGPEFVIPANAIDHTEQMLMKHRDDQKPLHVLSVTPHMHLLGTHQRVTLKHADGTEECMIDSGWDFDWQRTYTYDVDLESLPVFDASSTVDLTCHWNNSFSNPELPRLLENTGLIAPYNVLLGFTTGDEMCLADFGLLSRY
jgi:hypothetical protein